MSQPLFSIINPAMRDDRYETVYQSLSLLNRIPFEIVFVGPNPPQKSMPSNFRYITTDVKPAQCLEIAARYATGEYLITAGDDLTFSANFLNKMASYVGRLEGSKVWLSSKYSLGGVFHDGYFTFDPTMEICPMVGVANVIRREVWHEMGGVDRRFVACFADTDIQMRLHEKGYTLFITPDCSVDEIPPVDMNTLFRRSAKSERLFLNSLWINKYGLSKTRLSLVEPFSDNNILSVSQDNFRAIGKRGKHVW